MYEISIVMGSKSDVSAMLPAHELLKSLEVSNDVRILSAHRTPQDLIEYVQTSPAKVFIAGAGMAAHLAGFIAAFTNRPVIAVPLSGSLQGLDSLLSMVQMPPGVPVAVVAINGAVNAALLAVQILAIENKTIEEKLIVYKQERVESVQKADRNLSDRLG